MNEGILDFIGETVFSNVSKSPLDPDDNEYTKEKGNAILAEAQRQTLLAAFIKLNYRKTDSVDFAHDKQAQSRFWYSLFASRSLYEGPVSPEYLVPYTLEIRILLLAPTTDAWLPFRKIYLSRLMQNFSLYYAALKQRRTYLEAARKWHMRSESSSSAELEELDKQLKSEFRRRIIDNLNDFSLTDKLWGDKDLRLQMYTEVLANSPSNFAIQRLYDVFELSDPEKTAYLQEKTQILKAFCKLATWKSFMKQTDVLAGSVLNATGNDYLTKVSAIGHNRFNFFATAVSNVGCQGCGFNWRQYMQFFELLYVPAERPLDILYLDIPYGPAIGACLAGSGKSPSRVAISNLTRTTAARYRKAIQDRTKLLQKDPSAQQRYVVFLIAKVQVLYMMTQKRALNSKEQLLVYLNCNSFFPGPSRRNTRLAKGKVLRANFETPRYKTVLSYILSSSDVLSICRFIRTETSWDAVKANSQYLTYLQNVYTTSVSVSASHNPNPFFGLKFPDFIYLDVTLTQLRVTLYRMSSIASETAFDVFTLFRSHQLVLPPDYAKVNCDRVRNPSNATPQKSFDESLWNLIRILNTQLPSMDDLRAKFFAEMAKVSCVKAPVSSNTEDDTPVALNGDSIVSNKRKLPSEFVGSNVCLALSSASNCSGVSFLEDCSSTLSSEDADFIYKSKLRKIDTSTSKRDEELTDDEYGLLYTLGDGADSSPTLSSNNVPRGFVKRDNFALQSQSYGLRNSTIVLLVFVLSIIAYMKFKKSC